MPVASRLLLPAVILIGGIALACGGGDDDNGDGSEPTRTRTVSATTSPTAAAGTATTTAGPDEKTPGTDGESPIQTSGATAPPPASQGTPAVEPADTIAYLAQYQGRTDIGEEACTYIPATRLTDCGPRGLYSVRPPLGGQDVSCFITIAGGAPEFIRCTSAEPSETKWYDIQ
jgi:hypothetical protein